MEFDHSLSSPNKDLSSVSLSSFHSPPDNANMIYSFFSTFVHRMKSMPKLLELIKTPPDEYNTLTPSSYGVIYSKNAEMKIKLSNKTENINEYISSAVDESNLHLSLYKPLKLNLLKNKIFVDVFIKNTLPASLETKLNKYIYKDDIYLKYILQKEEKIKKGILLPPLRGYETFFIHDEIQVEITPINDIVYANLSSSLTSLIKDTDNISLLSSINDIISHLDNYHMLCYVEYFIAMFALQVKLNDNPLSRIRKENFKKLMQSVRKKKNKKENIAPIEQNSEQSQETNELYIEIKTELEKKEKEINTNLQRTEINFLYIDSKTMSKKEIEKIAKIIKKLNCKMFAWYFDTEETKKFGIENCIQIGTISTIKDLHCYLIDKLYN